MSVPTEHAHLWLTLRDPSELPNLLTACQQALERAQFTRSFIETQLLVIATLVEHARLAGASKPTFRIGSLILPTHEKQWEVLFFDQAGRSRRSVSPQSSTEIPVIAESAELDRVRGLVDEFEIDSTIELGMTVLTRARELVGAETPA